MVLILDASDKNCLLRTTPRTTLYHEAFSERLQPKQNFFKFMRTIISVTILKNLRHSIHKNNFRLFILTNAMTFT